MLFKKSGLIIFFSSNIFFFASYLFPFGHNIFCFALQRNKSLFRSEADPCFETDRILVSKRTESLFRNGPNHCFEVKRILVLKWKTNTCLEAKWILFSNKTNPCWKQNESLFRSEANSCFEANQTLVLNRKEETPYHAIHDTCVRDNYFLHEMPKRFCVSVHMCKSTMHIAYFTQEAIWKENFKNYLLT